MRQCQATARLVHNIFTNAFAKKCVQRRLFPSKSRLCLPNAGPVGRCTLGLAVLVGSWSSARRYHWIRAVAGALWSEKSRRPGFGRAANGACGSLVSQRPHGKARVAMRRPFGAGRPPVVWVHVSHGPHTNAPANRFEGKGDILISRRDLGNLGGIQPPGTARRVAAVPEDEDCIPSPRPSPTSALTSQKGRSRHTDCRMIARSVSAVAA